MFKIHSTHTWCPWRRKTKVGKNECLKSYSRKCTDINEDLNLHITRAICICKNGPMMIISETAKKKTKSFIKERK